jgi:two-component system chemotaxis sensor kinase CheA
MRARDDLIAAFGRGMPSRVAEATELWLGFERGQTQNLPILRRLLHTVKGEAHILELPLCGELAELAESVVDALAKSAGVTALTGDALLGAFEGMGMVTGEAVADERSGLEPLLAQLRAAIEEQRTLAGSGKEEKIPAATAIVAERAPLVGQAAAGVLKADSVRSLVHEMRRLYGEQAVFHEKLRETQRMLRALLLEIDPRQSPEGVAERITKTLGYGAEVDRRLSAIRADWSGNDFAMGLALDELDAVVRRASVVSAERLLNQVVRVGRSTARTLDKDVELQVSGSAILDAAIEQRLEPSLLHLVRNAIDHGVEAAELRRSRRKAARGTVSVSISQTESSVTVEVADDGGGVDFERLRDVLRGRVPLLEGLRDEELLPYLLEQGVTTCAQVTPISGRGVGLDVVAREIGAAGGQVRIESSRELGTRVILDLPATLSGEFAVPIVSGKQTYAVPSRAVHAAMRIDAIERTGEGLWLSLPDTASTQSIRLYSLERLLGGAGEPKVGDAVVVLYHSAGLYALSVDGYDNPRPITIQRSESLPFRSPLVRGVAPTPDGGVLILLDVEALRGAARAPISVSSAAPARSRGQPRALVVEDAPVARELLCGILRSLGFRVEEATDGRQGLLMAREARPDLVLTDIEMPYMNGIELIAELRRAGDLEDLPVIVLTTAATAENIERLSALGVVAVLSKQGFVEAELRELIERQLESRPRP